MRPCTLTIASCVLATSIASGMLATLASAQSPANRFAIWPDSTSATTRGTLAGNAGEILQGVPATHFRGVGDNGSACTFVSATYLTQDQNAATQESYSIIVRSAAMGGGPDATAAGILFQSGMLQTPAGTGTLAWTITATFTTPITLPCAADYFMGLSLAANAGWATDGQSLHMASYTWLGGSFPMTHDNPRSTGATNHAYNISSTGTVTQPAARVFNFGLDTRAAVLNMGNVDNVTMPPPSPMGISFGAGGMYPAIKETTRDDGLTSRIRDAAHSGGTAYLLLGASASSTGLAVPPFAGRLWLNIPPLVVVGSAALSATGEAQIQVVPPGKVPAGVKGFFLYFQGLTVDTGLTALHLSNVQGVSL